MHFRIVHQEPGGRKGAGGEQEGRETERERGGFRSTSFSLPLPLPGSGLPHPPQGARLGNSWERVRRRSPAKAVIKSLSHLQQVGSWVRAQICRGAGWGRKEHE